MFRVLFLSVTIYLFSIVMIWGSVPSKPELGESREDQSVCIERTWVCGQVGSVVRHPPCDECVHWVQGGTVTSFYSDTGTMKTHHVEGLEMCASCRPAASPERGRRGAELCPPASFSHAYWSDQAPAFTWGEGLGVGVPLIYVPSPANMEWAWVSPNISDACQSSSMFIIHKVIFNHLGTYLYCKLVKGFDKAKECKWNKTEML